MPIKLCQAKFAVEFWLFFCVGFDQVEMPEDSVLRIDVDKFGWEGHTAKVPVLVLTTIFFLSGHFQQSFRSCSPHFIGHYPETKMFMGQFFSSVDFKISPAWPSSWLFPDYIHPEIEIIWIYGWSNFERMTLIRAEKQHVRFIFGEEKKTSPNKPSLPLLSVQKIS